MVGALMKPFLTKLKIQEDDIAKLVAAVLKIKEEGVGFKRKRAEEASISASALGDLSRA